MYFEDGLADILTAKVKEKGTPLCVGFDPHLHLLPDSLLMKHMFRRDNPFKAYAAAVEEYLLTILDRITPHVAVIKPQFAFFEQLGVEGIRVLSKLCREARYRGLLVIGDAKRGDIGSTASAYASAYLPEHLQQDPPTAIPLDAVTLNPYLGFDSIEPFLVNRSSTGVFILVKTSNPSGADLQDLKTETGTLAEVVSTKVNKWGESFVGESGFSSVGAVVGATYPEEAGRLRNLMPKTLFLIPGFGAQGAGPDDAVVPLNKDGSGGVINSSRGILFAFRKEPYATDHGMNGYAAAAETACIEAKEQIRQALERKP